MKTPDEARQCWCPFATVIALGPNPSIQTSGFNRTSSDSAETLNPTQARCIAEECMAWRWAVSEPYEDDGGYCGLAGRP